MVQEIGMSSFCFLVAFEPVSTIARNKTGGHGRGGGARECRSSIFVVVGRLLFVANPNGVGGQGNTTQDCSDSPDCVSQGYTWLGGGEEAMIKGIHWQGMGGGAGGGIS